jgi:ribose 5-phosphate isomerase B
MSHSMAVWPPKKVLFASDHAGFSLKKPLMDWCLAAGIQIQDLGADDTTSVDYPDYAGVLAEEMSQNPDAAGILVCGTGIGISIAANRHLHIRAALCHDLTTARLCREHNDANVLVLGSRTTGVQTGLDCLEIFLSASFGAGRHSGRVAKLGKCDD